MEVHAYPAGEHGHQFVTRRVDLPVVSVGVGGGFQVEGGQRPAVDIADHPAGFIEHRAVAQNADAALEKVDRYGWHLFLHLVLAVRRGRSFLYVYKN
ncbi:hypothetical protein [Nocardia flavorosea]|uniref:Uncharacterized protein n=1 Tax=Nocardia flavorosea TaxID=53429 RepID=A0A846YUJ0_9NOCA|nr:hypothetical protein [Nocardia flavorosea]NKY60659.1 hypothetical protein [Nocardia flavorosea]